MLMPVRRPLEGLLTPVACRLLALVIILGAAVLRCWYLVSPNCPLDLAPDEGHYWQWSRHLDWSYYSKGPLVAWLIRASTELLGSWSLAATGSLMPAIRFPAVVSGALMLVGLYVLTMQVFRRDVLALAVVVGFAITPVAAVGSALMTIDAPYTCLWTWALVATHHAVFGRAFWAWPVAGLLVAVGIMAKYTMVIFLPSLGLFLLFTPGLRQELFRPGFWTLAVCAGLGAVPILIWNSQHNWVTFQHVFGLAGVSGGAKKWHLLGPLAYVGGQMALLMVGWFVLWVVAVIDTRPGVESDPGRLFLWWLSVPMFLVFLAFSPRTGGGELNWPVTAYLSGMVLVVGWLPEAWERAGPVRRWLTGVGIALCLSLGLVLTFVMHHSEVAHGLMTAVVGQPTPQHPLPLRKIDPTCRLRGWKELGQEVDRVREQLRREGSEPVLVGTNWSFPGSLGVYTQGQPETYSVGAVCGDRHSQYDFWSGPTNDPEPFLGKTFICVGIATEELRAGFASSEPTRVFVHEENGHPLAAWGITILRDFKGFPTLSAQRGH